MSTAQAVTTSSTRNLQEVEAYADKWLKIIHASTLTEQDARWVASESVHNFGEHFNQGWLDYRKSVTESCGDAACTEWRGEGSVFEDVMGRKFVDCLGGYGLLNLGWGHPEVVAAVKDQLVNHCPQPSQELLDPLRGVLARLLAQILPGDIDHCFFCNSGTEAVEGALKLAKLYTGKSGFISSVKGFHGKTLGSLSVSGKSVFREPLGTLYGGPVYHVPYGDAAAVEQTLRCCEAAGVGIAAVIMEPIQGEAGAIVPPDDFWPKIRESTRKYGVLLIADEVQTGLARTGKLFGVDHWNVVPDIITLGKALGGGVMPCAAFCSNKVIWEKMQSPNPFIHTTTTGGNPLACAAGIAAVRVTLRDKLWEQAAEKGKYLMDKLRLLACRFPTVLQAVTGKGLLIAMHFQTSAAGYRVAANLFKQRVLVAGTLNSAQSIRLEPPIIISYDQMNHVLACLERALLEVTKEVELQAVKEKIAASSAVAVATAAADTTPSMDKPKKRHHTQVVSDEEEEDAQDTNRASPKEDGRSSSSEDEESDGEGDMKKPTRVRKYRKARTGSIKQGHAASVEEDEEESVVVDEDTVCAVGDESSQTAPSSLSVCTILATPTTPASTATAPMQPPALAL